MNEKSLVEMQIPVEEVENVDELVSEGYYGCRSDAIRDIIRRGAVHVRARYPLHAVNEKRRGAVEEKETAKNNFVPTLTTRCKHIYMKTTQYIIGGEKC
jgi:Arc/MetJ-type ribon-helix-helix transcriptional regulator